MNHDRHDKTSNHERHEEHETHSARQEDTPYRVNVPSPLAADEEDVITRVIGCAVNVHKTLGPGFLESIYKKAMCIELEAQRLPFELERSISVTYRGIEIRGQRVDLIVANIVVVELKAISRFDEIHRPCLPQGLRRVVL